MIGTMKIHSTTLETVASWNKPAITLYDLSKSSDLLFGVLLLILRVAKRSQHFDRPTETKRVMNDLLNTVHFHDWSDGCQRIRQ